MNRYSFEEIETGHEESFFVCVTEEMLDGFAEISGDRNPLHTDTDYACRSGFRGRVAYGMLTASFLSTLAGEYLPGENSLIHTVETEFVSPVYPGDRLCVKGTVKSKNDTFRTIEVKAVITNAQGKKVLRGKMRIGLRQSI